MPYPSLVWEISPDPTVRFYMGEYATRKSDGEQVKIGTCESMYYLRADQRTQVKHKSGNVNPNSADALALRFRFPWPDEDTNLPGEFEPFERTLTVDVPAPQDTEHFTVQFSARPGYLVSLPCPEGKSDHGLTIHRNGFAGPVQLAYQKLLADGRLVPVCRCAGCGTMWRLEEPAEIEALAVAIRADGDSRNLQARNETAGAFWHTVADRITAGARLAPQLVA